MGSRVTPDELLSALEDARDLPDGDTKIAELDRIVAHADAAEDVRLGITARLTLIEAHAYHTERWRMLAPFEWCLAAFDRDPALFDPTEAELLRWYHKWAVVALRDSSRVGLARTEETLADLERRLGSGGHSPHAAYSLRCRIADHVGDESAARHWFAQWRDAPRDENSDCAGCDPANQAKLLTAWGRWAEAIEIVQPVLTGVLGCPEQPERTLASVQLAYLRLGRYDDAAQAHVRAYRRHRHERDAFPFLAEHLRFCALTGHYERGLDILARHLPWWDRPYDECSAMEFAAAGALLCRLAATAGFERHSIPRPAYADRLAAELTVTALGAELLAAAQDFAGRFDARNGTSHQSGRMAGWLAERPVPGVVALPPDGPVDEGSPTEQIPPGGRRELVGPLTTAAIVDVLRERADHYVVDPDGTVNGRWGDALIQFHRFGERREILHARVIAERRLSADRLAEAYEFCNAWNHDRLLPKAYVQDVGDGELILVGDVTTDLEHGVAAGQLGILVNATLATGAAFAAAVAALP
ncbi:type III secretion system chaperone family protein [Plantactinospora soyae]|uniref:YbjN domain-containing protein n=1 Tax=Plantactinospora soyae TaxID=1544732 RepID=UPI00298EFA91|nr:YbjN domain-containing protein [Plantactinospora soyae]